MKIDNARPSFDSSGLFSFHPFGCGKAWGVRDGRSSFRTLANLSSFVLKRGLSGSRDDGCGFRRKLGFGHAE
jgi:hypothetical protein